MTTIADGIAASVATTSGAETIATRIATTTKIATMTKIATATRIATATATTTTRMARVPRPRYLLPHRLGFWGIVLTAWDVWRRIPKKHRKRMLAELRQHAPTVARTMTREARRIRDTARRETAR
jgi:hypothetical protein